MSRKHFGTDGVRGVANQKLTPELALALGQAAGRWLLTSNGPRRAAIGRDTRRSGTMLSSALAAGLASAGIDVVDLGVAPTPAVAFVARTGDFGLGCIVSASHNPAPDNGIKLVGYDGRKLADEVELEIEGFMADFADRPVGGALGDICFDDGLLSTYVDYLVRLVPERVEKLTIVMDCAHGAAFELAPRAAQRLGAKVILCGADPDGNNINAEGGATKPEVVQRLTVERGADLGVAFDGDADRVVFSDANGRLVNGDRTIGIWAAHQRARGELNPPIVVGTVMSNGGFEKYMESLDIRLERTPVGDKYVAAKIAETAARVGGEQSGHIIYPEHGPTGDGLATMMEFLRVMRQSGKTSAELYESYDAWPQVMINLQVASTAGWQDAIAHEMEAAEEKLSGHGRMLVRPSGTQPVIRVMVEADEYALRDEVAESIVSAIEAKLGGEVHGRVDLTHALGD